MNEGEKADILQFFNNLSDQEPELSAAVAAIRTLLNYIEKNKIETISELRALVKDAIKTLMQTDSSVTSIQSGCELFLRFITLTTSLEHKEFESCKKLMVERGKLFLDKISLSRKKIAKQAHQFIRDGSTILAHSHSRVVLHVLTEAAKTKKRFQVFVTESRPNDAGKHTCEELSRAGIPNTLILDASVGYLMEKVDMVLCGAEGVVESGGIINKIGTFTIAIAAHAMNKPFYVVAESFKFVRFYPLNQHDVPNHFKFKASTLQSQSDLSKEHPLVDYTPPTYITLLFTDLGVLTPSAVSDELIKLYC